VRAPFFGTDFTAGLLDRMCTSNPYMITKRDKRVIECWLRLYNRLTSSTFTVVDWPDKDSSKKNIDAICRDGRGISLAVEHTLIEPFEGDKEDGARFMRTLGSLENHPDLLQPGYAFDVT